MMRTGNWLTLIPALAGCAFVMAASAEDVTSPSRAVRMAGNIDGIPFGG